MVVVPEDQIWMVVASFIVAFILAFAIGANDVANSFATSVGSKVLTLKQACILGSVFEVAGALLIGARVSDTIRKNMIDVTAYLDTPDVLVVGMVSALTGACVWLIIATVLKLPVSGTHSIVGAIVGFALVAKGTSGINWTKIGLIGASWVVSPLLSGLVSSLIFFLIRRFILYNSDSLSAGLISLPIFYGLTVTVNAFSVFLDGPEQLYLDRIPLWGTFVIAFGLGILTALAVRVFYVPRQRIRILSELDGDKQDSSSTQKISDLQKSDDSGLTLKGLDDKAQEKDCEKASKIAGSGASFDQVDDSSESSIEQIKDKPEVASLFSRLQILTAIFGSFTHGGNDVSNAIGPLVAVWLIVADGNVLQKAPTPIWVLFYGGVGIVVGLWALGRRVIETMGEGLTKITPSSGFTIEIGSALTVLIASKAGIPISTTHCKVGSVVCVGRVRSRQNVDWKIFRNIIIAWVVTLPAAGLISAGVFYGLQYLVPPLGPPWLISVPSNSTLNSTLILPLTKGMKRDKNRISVESSRFNPDMGQGISVTPDLVPVVVVGFIVSFVLAFGMGANDVANAFGTSVGSGVLTLTQACIIGSIFEVVGSLTLGQGPSQTIRKDIMKTSLFHCHEFDLLLGMVSSLSAAFLWLLVATLLKLPVSATHSVVCAVIGFGIAANDWNGITWWSFKDNIPGGAAGIVVAWVTSPVISGIISSIVFLLIRHLIINKKNSLSSGLRLMPFFYGFVSLIISWSIFQKVLTEAKWSKKQIVPWWGSMLMSFGVAAIVAIVIRLFLVPYFSRTIRAELHGESNAAMDSTIDTEKKEVNSEGSMELQEISVNSNNANGKLDETHDKVEEKEDSSVDKPEVLSIFSRLQILTAMFLSFTHGGNDVSNAISPLTTIWLIGTTGTFGSADTPWYLLLFGGLGIDMGLWILGRRVIQTVGQDLTAITSSSGFSVELGAAITSLIATVVKGFPMSTTHCVIGSVIAVGLIRSRKSVNFKLFSGIAFSWLVTVPFNVLASAGIYSLFRSMPIPPSLADNCQNITTPDYNTTAFGGSLLEH